MATAEKTLSPKMAAKKAISAAKKALQEGRKGASARLDKAIARFAKASCNLKTTTTRKSVTAKIGKKKKPAKK